MAKAPTHPGHVPPAPPKPPEAPVAPAAEEQPKKKKREKAAYRELFDTAEQAAEEAANRVKGPRKAFTVKDHTGKEWHVVHNNDGRALGAVAKACGFSAEEIGKGKRAGKAVSLEGILAGLNALDPKDREAVMQQLQQLGAAK